MWLRFKRGFLCSWHGRGIPVAIVYSFLGREDLLLKPSARFARSDDCGVPLYSFLGGVVIAPVSMVCLVFSVLFPHVWYPLPFVDWARPCYFSFKLYISWLVILDRFYFADRPGPSYIISSSQLTITQWQVPSDIFTLVWLRWPVVIPDKEVNHMTASMLAVTGKIP
jgi:hypothetical protein